jgi:tRNA(Ile)-lysidine synthase
VSGDQFISTLYGLIIPMNEQFSARLFEPGMRLVMGVSGGADSLCMLHLAKQVPRLRIIVAHFDHRLREGSGQEAQQVRRLAEAFNLAFVGGSADVRLFAREYDLSIEEAARIQRYRFLFSTARKHRADAVAVGHTADDQVETILMHFLRGAGLAGLKGMTGSTLLPEFDARIPLLRPILHLWRTETEAYCREHDLPIIQDVSNLDQAYFRNRLRHNLIPELETYNPEFKPMLLRTSSALAGDYEAIMDMVAGAWEQVVQEEDAGCISMRVPALLQLSPGLVRNIFRKAILQLNPSIRNLDFAVLQRAVDFISPVAGKGTLGTGPKQVDLVEGFHLFREGDLIHLAGSLRDIPAGEWPQLGRPRRLKLNSQAALNDGFRLTAEEVDAATARREARLNQDPHTAWLDLNAAGTEFTLRPRRPGDSFAPLGMDGKVMKLHDLFINEKIPVRVRAAWPLVCAGEEIAWVTGLRLAHPFRITSRTRRAVRLSLVKK